MNPDWHHNGTTLADVAYDGSWGEYADAVGRHEEVFGRPAPAPTDDKGRLSPRFVEWMMGLPEGWVTDVDLSRTAQLRVLGNAVVPRQAVAAWGSLLGIPLEFDTHTHTHTSLPTPTARDAKGATTERASLGLTFRRLAPRTPTEPEPTVTAAQTSGRP